MSTDILDEPQVTRFASAPGAIAYDVNEYGSDRQVTLSELEAWRVALAIVGDVLSRATDVSRFDELADVLTARSSATRNRPGPTNAPGS